MIRQAVRGDAAKAVPLILDAIGVIASVLTGTPQEEETASILNGEHVLNPDFLFDDKDRAFNRRDFAWRMRRQGDP